MLDLKFSLSSEDIVKILKGALIAALGAGLVYALQGLAALNFGIYTPIAVAVSSVLINVVRKWLGIG